MAIDERAILRTELRWAAVVAAMVLAIVAAIIGSGIVLAVHPPSNVETIDPATLHISGEFTEANLGTRQNPDGSVTARFIAMQFSFVPRCLPVPQGKEVTLRVTSPDVIHGLLVTGTNVNTMVIPGYVSQVRATFKEAGDHLMPCHEFCGLGHSEMWSVVRVIPQDQWHPDADGRVACDVSK